jgi:pyruvate dehydrogenase E1 component alpha subunit
VVVDGQDVLAVWRATTEAAERAKRGEGPTLLDVKTYRYREHAEFGRVGDKVRTYRTVEEIDQWRQRDPIELFARDLQARGVLDGPGVETLRKEVAEEVASAVKFAQESPFPDLREAYEHTFIDPLPPEVIQVGAGQEVRQHV